MFRETYLIELDPGRIVDPEISQHRGPFRHHVGAHVYQAEHAAALTFLPARGFAQTARGASGGDAAVGVGDHENVFAVCFDGGSQFLAHAVGVLGACRGCWGHGVDAWEWDGGGWETGGLEMGRERAVG